MKTKTKEFDCVEMMHRGAFRIYEETKDMSVEEELAYWRQRHTEALKELTRDHSISPPAK
jgi:hypothetical protein